MAGIKRILKELSFFNYEVIKTEDLSMWSAWLGMLITAALYSASPSDYMRYKFYKKSFREIGTYITYGRSKRLIKKYNSIGSTKYLQDKSLFNDRFSLFAGRRWLCLRMSSSREFLDFFEKEGKIIVKPRCGGQGRKIEIKEYDGAERALIFYENHRDFIAEEVIIQHSALSNLNPSSVNTVRVAVFCFGGVVNFLSATLRIGSEGEITDNLSGAGVACNVDFSTGIVDRAAMNMSSERFIKHPGSGATLVGVEIPFWNDVKEMVVKLSLMIPEIMYVGWDIAITPTGPIVIEGNHDAGHRTIQMVSDSGKYYIINKAIKSAQISSLGV